MKQQFSEIIGFKLAAVLLLACLSTHEVFAAEGGGHPHHIAVGAGFATYDSKNSTFIGADYVYRFSGGPWAAGLFYEEVSGDFNLQAWGVSGGYFFSNGFKLGAGIGAEYKIDKDKTLALVHITGGYDWHFGNWTLGPTATIDFIENGSRTYYLGVALGYGF